MCFGLLHVGLDELPQLVHLGPSHVGDPLPALEEDERRRDLDAELLAERLVVGLAVELDDLWIVSIGFG